MAAQVDSMVNLLNEYRPVLFSAYDVAGQPTQFEALCRRSGNWLPILFNWPYMVYDASSGSTPKISVQSGSHNGSIIPTLGGTPINTIPAPTLTLSGTDAIVWFEISYNSSNVVTSISINHGTLATFAAFFPVTIAQGTAGTDYYGLSSVVVTTGASASVQCLNDFVSGPQFYSQCGTASQSLLM